MDAGAASREPPAGQRVHSGEVVGRALDVLAVGLRRAPRNEKGPAAGGGGCLRYPSKAMPTYCISVPRRTPILIPLCPPPPTPGM
jgi:hypothetical protein